MKRIVIAVSSTHFLRWHQQLRDTLAARWPTGHVSFRLAAQAEPASSAADRLIAMERLLLLGGKATLCDRLDPPLVTEGVDADIVIDLSGNAPDAGARVLRPLYDGHASDQAAIAALLSGDAPMIAIEDATTGAIVAEGLPSLETANSLLSGLEAIYSRVALLIETAVANPWRRCAPATRLERLPAAPLAYLLRNLSFQCTRALYHLCCHSPHWRVGWRFTSGTGVIETGAITGAPWRLMLDREMGFAADPFPIEWRGHTGVFYERMNYRDDRGEIWYQAFDDHGPAGEPVPALREPFHLSYPFLIEEDGELYMIPEASASRAVTLYRCVAFPDRWEPVARMLDNVEAADATVFRHDGRYWMTSVVRNGVGGYSDTLAIHHASSLFGPWEPHALNPVVVDARFSRPAGAVVMTPSGLYRPVQDCLRGYGTAMEIMRIDRLDSENFGQTPVARLEPGAAWPGARLHTLNRCGRLECIDGAILTPKYLPLRRLTRLFVDRNWSTAEASVQECAY